MRILMVCMGNICRSPLAEGIMAQKIKSNGLDWEVDSAGTHAWHIGEHPDPRAIKTAKLQGVDISRQTARIFNPVDFLRFDLILTMDAENYQFVNRLARTAEEKNKIQLILNYSSPNYNKSVPDPYYTNKFQEVFVLLEEACEQIINKHIAKQY